ncbi:MAG: class B sortase [Lachnospiraceae bacterium]|nr:class B sortase [Lachnospiraceae bacterium]
MKNKGKKIKRKQVIYVVSMIFFACVFVCSALYLGIYYFNSWKSERKVDNLKEKIITTEQQEHSQDESPDSTNSWISEEEILPSYVEIDGTMVQEKFVELYKLNHDFIGWINIDDTAIDYPVMQTPDNEEYYLHKDFEKKYSLAGSLFADTDSDIWAPSDNIMIYGHHMQSGKMFQNLTKYESETFYLEHRYISFDTICKDGTYEVIAAFKTQIYDSSYTGFKYYQFFNAKDANEFNTYISNCKALMTYNIPSTAVYGDELLTLSTCNYHTSNGRFVVVAKKIK